MKKLGYARRVVTLVASFAALASTSALTQEARLSIPSSKSFEQTEKTIVIDLHDERYNELIVEVDDQEAAVRPMQNALSGCPAARLLP